MVKPNRQMQRRLQGGPGRKMTAPPEVPVNNTESNARGDRMALGLYCALILASVVTLGGGVWFSATRFNTAVSQAPIDWSMAIMMSLVLIATLLVARSLFWLAYFGTVMLSSRIGAWKTCESICRQAIKLPPGLSRGTSWASVALTQSLVARGEYKDAIVIADEEWARSGSDPRQVQNLGPLCVTTGMASQLVDDSKESLKWNERGIECLNKAMEDLEKPKKGLFNKAMAPQSTEWIGQVRTQLAVAHFNIATMYLSKGDRRRGKENFKKANDYANQAPDFPQKSDIMKVSRDQLSALKHV